MSDLPDLAQTLTKAPPRRARTSKGEARRQRLLEVAAQSFLEHGYAGTSVGQIVGQAKGSVATAYQLFGSKEGLLAEVLCRELDVLAGIVFAAMPGAQSAHARPVRSALPLLAQRLLAASLAPRSLAFYRLLTTECERLPKLIADLMAAADDSIYAPLQACLSRAAQRGELAVDDPHQAARLLGYQIQGIAAEARLVADYPATPTVQHRQACEYGVQAFLRAFSV